MNDNDTPTDDLRKGILALMNLLAAEKHKSEALEAELAGVRSDLAMCEAKGSSLQMRTDKADLLRVLGVADERIKALEAEVAEARRCLDGGTDCMDDKRKLRAALRQIAEYGMPLCASH
jgi:predicted RNase H-like nuclease (RuvC/YqgF family)